MKHTAPLFVVGLLAVCFVSSTPTQNLNELAEVQGIIDDLVNSTIKDMLDGIVEPIAIDSLELNFTDELLKGDAGISGFQLSGIKGLVAPYIDIGFLSMALNMTVQIPRLILNTKYHADVVLANLVSLYGHGEVGVTIDGAELLINGKANLQGGLSKGYGLSLSNATIVIGLGGAQFDLHGLMDDEGLSALISKMLNETLVEFINDNKGLISEIISPIATEIINAILKGNKTSTEFLEMENTINLINLE